MATTTRHLLHRNNGNGTFTRITTGGVVTDVAISWGGAWVDYDYDGFIDLFVTTASSSPNVHNFLYRNNGNTNTWFKIKLVGTASNRAAIGAKVRVKATTGGRTVLQLREISSGSGYAGQNTLAHFGLGNATNIDLVRIEWPSGIVQTMTNVAAKQFLTVMEHQEPDVVTAPDFTSVSRSANGAVDLSVTGDTGLLYLFEASTNLVNWSWLGVRTNATGTTRKGKPKPFLLDIAGSSG